MRPAFVAMLSLLQSLWALPELTNGDHWRRRILDEVDDRRNFSHTTKTKSTAYSLQRGLAESASKGDSNFQYEKLKQLYDNRKQTIIAHMHIPKACGTAVGISLTSGCSRCNYNNVHFSCTECRQVIDKVRPRH